MPKIYETHRRIAAIATFSDGKNLDSATEFYLQEIIRALRHLNYEVVIGIALKNVFTKPSINLHGAEIIYRRNHGYDFGTWHTILKKRKVFNSDEWIFLNTSLLGPFFNPIPFLEAFISKKADYVGVTESFELKHHYQSYMWRANGKILLNPKISSVVWGHLRPNNRQAAILQKEIQVLGLVQEAGMTAEVLFPAGVFCPSNQNQTIISWDQLLRAGFPFVKASLSRKQEFQNTLSLVLRSLT